MRIYVKVKTSTFCIRKNSAGLPQGLVFQGRQLHWAGVQFINNKHFDVRRSMLEKTPQIFFNSISHKDHKVLQTNNLVKQWWQPFPTMTPFWTSYFAWPTQRIFSPRHSTNAMGTAFHGRTRRKHRGVWRGDMAFNGRLSCRNTRKSTFIFPIPSMCGIFTYIWLSLMVKYGKCR